MVISWRSASGNAVEIAAAARAAADKITATHRAAGASPAGSAAISATDAQAAAACSFRCRSTSLFPRQKPGWVSAQAALSLGRAALIRASYLLAVLTLTSHSSAIMTATAARASATRHPAVHVAYQPIQLGSSRSGFPAACQATVLSRTDAAALASCTVAASASNRSRSCRDPAIAAAAQMRDRFLFHGGTGAARLRRQHEIRDVVHHERRQQQP